MRDSESPREPLEVRGSSAGAAPRGISRLWRKRRHWWGQRTNAVAGPCLGKWKQAWGCRGVMRIGRRAPGRAPSREIRGWLAYRAGIGASRRPSMPGQGIGSGAG
jgi:hypothetical protein